ncbi:glycosyltransferase family 2 protein [Photorhabdus akhurstii]|uniref:glycosyltransferase family 2 protein n=1 Tax=Photorhabdus akhurstii TaxID=171438 RepID=UPI003704476F
MLSFSLIIPTRNGSTIWHTCIESLKKQTNQPTEVIIVDSRSSDKTAYTANQAKFTVYNIDPKHFNHGGTRNYAVSLAKNSEFLVFLTQDAILANSTSLEKLLSCFDDPKVVAVCGRQIPHDDASPLAKHARFFNYQEQSCIKSRDNVANLGLKTAFMSNSFAAYRRDVFEKLGGFPENTILAEDMYLAAKMILAGYKVSYCAEATVKHSHNYSPWEEFRRYFDTGVFHTCEPWIQQQFGGASGEGMKFVKSELEYLWHHAPLWIPRSLLTTVCKLIGYKLGKNYRILPKKWRPKFSMYKSYWLQQK